MADPLAGLAACLGRRLAGAGLTIATAESCTGGLVAHLLTEIPGSSAWFRGGIVAYADDLKRDLLGVDAERIARHGAVSAEVAAAMAEGARRRTGATIAVAVTGIAGPGGGSAEKPIGRTWIAVAGATGLPVTRRHDWAGGRSANKRASARAALELALELLGSDAAPGPGARRDAEAQS